MSIISTLLIKEKNRNESMIIEYTRELDALPKGTIKEKKVKELKEKEVKKMNKYFQQFHLFHLNIKVMKMKWKYINM